MLSKITVKEKGTLVLKQLGDCGRKDRRIRVAVGHPEHKSDEGELAVNPKNG